MEKTTNKPRIDLPPSHFVRMTRRYLGWSRVCICRECNLVGKYEDLHRIDPCPRCGAVIHETVGRWVRVTPGTWWKLWFDAVWTWELHLGAPTGGVR